ncbi:hypothetical protein BDV41DRAFT_547692 [Aspergillus transmontanensis]|uniref:DUF7580 domain-containing protein n=1 Tax=Aspergillus transmontanensis TaxID=1034304 RepID=A0A5N6VLP9_9EURO|nr:hypothetical protein BDV41DRAFT_547692 [Aspergillus transmontanensis]
MSGFEVVGVVLGAIPLIISALDYYKVTSQRIKFMIKKELLLNQLIQSLEEQKFYFQTDICLALKETHLEEKQIIALIDERGLNLFQDPEISDALKEYLGEGFTLYLNAVARCEHILSDIVSNISGLVATSQWNTDDLPTILQSQPKRNGRFEFTKRIKFSVGKEDLQRQIHDLDESTKTLSRLRDQSIARQNVKVQPISRTIAKFTAALNVVQSYAHRLYSAISCGCIAGCHPEHEARLFLQTRSSAMNKSHSKSLKKPAVSFIITFYPRPMASCPPFLRNKHEVKVLEEDLDHFEDNLKIDRAIQQVVQINPPSPPRTPSPSAQLIEDLCQSIHRAYESRQSLDLYLSRCAKLCYSHGPVDPGANINTSDGPSHDTITLKDALFNMQDSESTMPKWTINQQMALSFNIASSMMQLHSTPWLSFPLTSSSVRFTPDSMKLKGTPQPFIVSAFPIRNQVTTPYTPKASMLELGIMLLEIWHLRSIDSYASERDLEMDNSYGTRYEIARNWVSFSDDNILPFYLELVTRCIECTFATTSATPDWGDLTFRRSVCEHVLKPLWENCPQKLR